MLMGSAVSMANLAPASSSTIARGAFWRVVEICSSEILGFAFMIVLARLLSPADYGVVAIATMMLMLAQLIVKNGVIQVVIQRATLTDRLLNSALALNLAVGVGLAILLALIAEPMARAADKPDLGPILLALSWLCIPQAAVWIYVAVLRRSLDYRGLALRALVAGLLGGVVSVAMAMRGWGVWSLVGLQVVNGVVSLAAVAVSAGWRPTFDIGRAELRELGRQSIPIIGAATASTFNQVLPTLVFGIVLPASVVGHFFVAQRLLLSISMLTVASVSDLALPVLARLQGSPEGHREAARQALRLGGLVCMPTFVGAALMAGPLVFVLFGPAWVESIVLLQLLLAIGLASAVITITGQILLSVGRRRLVLYMNLMTMLPPVLVVCALSPLGLPIALGGGLAMVLACLPFVLRRLGRTLGLRVRELLADQLPCLAATCLMAIGVLLLNRIDAHWQPHWQLAAGVASGVITFVAGISILDAGLVRQVLASIQTPRLSRTT